jgi:DNA polymerase/3'-5' exonuclease PolX
MSYVDVDILAIPWESRGAALIYFTVRPNLFKMLRRLSRGRGCSVTTL